MTTRRRNRWCIRGCYFASNQQPRLRVDLLPLQTTAYVDSVARCLETLSWRQLSAQAVSFGACFCPACQGLEDASSPARAADQSPLTAAAGEHQKADRAAQGSGPAVLDCRSDAELPNKGCQQTCLHFLATFMQEWRVCRRVRGGLPAVHGGQFAAATR